MPNLSVSELAFDGETLIYKAKNGFKSLQNKFLLIGDPTAWLSELLGQREYVALSMRELGVLISHTTSSQ